MPAEQYPSNSRTVRPKTDEAPAKPVDEKKIEKVVEGKVIRRKKPFTKRVVDNLIGEEHAGNVFDYIVQDVVVPATKDLISDAFTTFVERMLFGESVNRRHRRGGGSNATRTDYQGISSRTVRRDEPRREMSSRGRANFEFEEIVLDTRHEADSVIEQMYDLLRDFDVVTVADLYGMIGQTNSFTDTKWGWEGPGSLNGARALRVKGGFLLDLPRPSYID